MFTYEIIKRAIALRDREIQEVTITIGTSREHLFRSVNERFSQGDASRTPNFAQALVDKLFEELGLRIVLVMDDLDVLLPDQ